MLAQMILLMANPEMFHKITNKWPLTEDGKRVVQLGGFQDPIDVVEVPVDGPPVDYEQVDLA